MTKAKEQEKQEAIEWLREWLKPGDTICTVLRRVSSSGMSRHISVHRIEFERIEPAQAETAFNLMQTAVQEGASKAEAVTALVQALAKPSIEFLSWYVAKALGYRFSEDTEALVVGGCGMDMGFHVVYSLSYALFGDGYALNQKWI